MAIILTEKFVDKIDEKFTLGALSAAGVNNDYDWAGAKTIKVTSIPTVPMNDYKREGTERYGTPTELQNEIQEMTLSRDRSFTFTIDKMNEEESAITAAGQLAKQIDEVVIPEIDAYRFGVMAAAGKAVTIAAGENTAYAAVLDATEQLDDALVPQAGRVLFVSNGFYKGLKKDPSFVLATESGQQIKFKGQVGDVDGNMVIKVPSNRLPKGVQFILTHPSATVAVNKLADYLLHVNPVGISGSIAEGRIYYDAFVLNNKKGAIAVGKLAGK